MSEIILFYPLRIDCSVVAQLFRIKLPVNNTWSPSLAVQRFY